MIQDNSKQNNDIINHDQFEEMRDLLEEDFTELVQTYIVDSQRRVALLRTAQMYDDNANGFEAAHALKGASANIGATQLVNLSEQLQHACRDNTISEQADVIEQLDIALEQVKQEINKRLEQ